MTANKNAITTSATVVISKRDDEEGALPAEVEVGVIAGVELEDEGAGVGLKGVFAGTVTVCVLLQALVSPSNTSGHPPIGGTPGGNDPSVTYPIIAST